MMAAVFRRIARAWAGSARGATSPAGRSHTTWHLRERYTHRYLKA